MRRFDPGYRRMRDMLRNGDIGAALVLHCVSRGVSSGPGATDESSIVGSTIHDLDVVPWLLDSPIVEVSWHAGRSAGGVDFTDPQVMLLRTADGALSTVETFLNAGYGYDIRCEIVGERGTVVAARAGPSGGRRAARPLRRLCRRLAAAVRRGLPDRAAGLGRIECAECRTRSSVTSPRARDGLVATAVAEAMVASMRAGGRYVAVPSEAWG